MGEIDLDCEIDGDSIISSLSAATLQVFNTENETELLYSIEENCCSPSVFFQSIAVLLVLLVSKQKVRFLTTFLLCIKKSSQMK